MADPARTSFAMLRLLNKFIRSRSGVAAVEFALLVPIILTSAALIIELGRGLAQASAVEKGLRGGAMLAARSSWPLVDATELSNIKNMVMTGTVDGSGSPLVDGWVDTSTVTITTSTTTISGEDINIVSITAEAPFNELLPGITTFIGLSNIIVRTTHAQVYIGN